MVFLLFCLGERLNERHAHNAIQLLQLPVKYTKQAYLRVVKMWTKYNMALTLEEMGTTKSLKYQQPNFILTMKVGAEFLFLHFRYKCVMHLESPKWNWGTGSMDNQLYSHLLLRGNDGRRAFHAAVIRRVLVIVKVYLRQRLTTKTLIKLLNCFRTFLLRLHIHIYLAFENQWWHVTATKFNFNQWANKSNCQYKGWRKTLQ